MKTQISLFVVLLMSVGTITAVTQGEKKPRTDADYARRTLRGLTMHEKLLSQQRFTLFLDADEPPELVTRATLPISKLELAEMFVP